MATATKSSGGRAGRKSSTSKRTSGRGKSTAKSAGAGSRGGAARRSTAAKQGGRSKSTPRSGTRQTTAKRATTKSGSSGTRSARKQSPVTRIKRVAGTVLQQGASAAKQGVQAVERLVEEVKDRVTA